MRFDLVVLQKKMQCLQFGHRLFDLRCFVKEKGCQAVGQSLPQYLRRNHSAPKQIIMASQYMKLSDSLWLVAT